MKVLRGIGRFLMTMITGISVLLFVGVVLYLAYILLR